MNVIISFTVLFSLPQRGRWRGLNFFGNCQLSTEETEEKKRFHETEQLNTEFLNTLKRNCHLPSVPSAFNEKKLYFCIRIQ